ncbi:MAG: hypothetical protein LBN99_08665, partial [Oscillospiraceae bacterium]|jgi:hypothetical protein|nr:hypothetical protein [Oscillospiraceae bacterium]
MVYDNNKGGEYGKYFVQELTEAARNMGTPDFRELYSKFAQRILWIDGDTVPGAFQMNTAWYKAVPERDPIFTEHIHDNGELIGFYGSNPDDPYDLGGVIEFSIGGEAHRLTRSTLIYLPGNVTHNPMRILEVNRPIFHFSVVTTAQYDGGATYK